MGCRKLAYYEKPALPLRVLPENDEVRVIVVYRIELKNGKVVQGWFTTDPAEQFANPYLAMGNNPVRYTDPNGLYIAPPGEGVYTGNGSSFGGDPFGWTSQLNWGANHDSYLLSKSSWLNDYGAINGSFADVYQNGQRYSFNGSTWGYRSDYATVSKDLVGYTSTFGDGSTLTEYKHVSITGSEWVSLGSDQGGGREFPSFNTLWSNYPADNADGTHAHPSSDPYQNQCAIRLGSCLQQSGVDMSNYNTGPVTTEGYPRGAKSLADWIWMNYERPTIVSQSDFQKNYWNQTGIIFIKAYPGYANHIDLFNQGTTGSGYYSGSEIWFWNIK